MDSLTWCGRLGVVSSHLSSSSMASEQEAALAAAATLSDSDSPNIFDKIINKEIPSKVVYEDDQVYFDFMRSFRTEFDDFFVDGLISTVEIGLGASGELKYPCSSERMGWRYPGIGEFQCYDKYLQQNLRKAAKNVDTHFGQEDLIMLGNIILGLMKLVSFVSVVIMITIMVAFSSTGIPKH